MSFHNRLERIIRSRWGILLLVGPYVAVVAVASLSLAQYTSEKDARVSAVEAQQHADCLQAADGRRVLRTVVEEATAPGRPVNLTAIPGFEQLDPTMQTYLQNLASALAARDPDEAPLRDRLLALIPELDCPEPVGG